jgi:hypothetical protein
MKLYVLIDQQYEPSYRAVQAGHAVAAYMLATMQESTAWKNHTLVYLLTKKIDLDYRMMSKKGLTCIPFHEPDVGGKMTAFACYADDGMFSKYVMA